jgi:hypothetical protein
VLKKRSLRASNVRRRQKVKTKVNAGSEQYKRNPKERRGVIEEYKMR